MKSDVYNSAASVIHADFPIGNTFCELLEFSCVYTEKINFLSWFNVFNYQNVVACKKIRRFICMFWKCYSTITFFVFLQSFVLEIEVRIIKYDLISISDGLIMIRSEKICREHGLLHSRHHCEGVISWIMMTNFMYKVFSK